ncbi:MAG: hypothetical protein ACYCSF_08740 [Acidimicrobiales bacterium]
MGAPDLTAREHKSPVAEISYLLAVDIASSKAGRQKLAAGTAYEDEGWLIADELGRSYYPTRSQRGSTRR